MTTAAPEREKTLAPKARDPYFSNAKFALIVLVVIGHAWAPIRGDSNSVHAFYITLYAFHMPAFILLSGYFSKTFTARPDQLRRVLTGILAPYLIFSILYEVLQYFTDENEGTILLDPYYLLWFLAALFVWRMTCPLWRLIRQPFLVALLISMGALVLDLPGTFDVGRILQFLPFFVAGMHMKREHFEMLRRPLVRVVGLAASLAILAAAFFFGGELEADWVKYTDGAEQLDVTVWEALPVRLTLMIAAGVLMATFLAWIPQRQLPTTRLGDMTMYPFLLHGFFVKLANHTWEWYDLPAVNTGAGAIGVTVLSVALTLVLCTPPVRWLTRPVVEPKLNWILRKEEERRKPRPYPS
ncbi:MAG: acyltransferase family protein [Stackebrandtia sp.]